MTGLAVRALRPAAGHVESPNDVLQAGNPGWEPLLSTPLTSYLSHKSSVCSAGPWWRLLLDTLQAAGPQEAMEAGRLASQVGASQECPPPLALPSNRTCLKLLVRILPAFGGASITAWLPAVVRIQG